MAAIVLDDVWKIYADGTEAVRGLDLDIGDKEFIVLVGPSGCGKTTALRMIAGLEVISRGSVAIGGRVVNDMQPKARDIAMVFQNYALYPHMSVYGNMAYGLKIRGMSKADIDTRVKRAAEILELGPLLERKPRQLSGGQRQRVAMGRAIVREPAVFLFDEPLSNLDAKLRVQMRFEIQKLHRRLGTTSLYVTHDQVEAMTLAQRMVVMNAGRAEQIGTPMEVYQNPATVFVAGFIGSPAMNFIDGRSMDDGRIQLDGSGVLIVPKAPAAGKKITVGIRPEHLTPSKPSEANLVGSVEVIEALGADTLLHVAVAGRTIIARLPAGTPAEVGEPIALAADRDRIYMFDADTGARVRV
jgi:sn-glycerol 3-phosphate transport system ATP-binding protein